MSRGDFVAGFAMFAGVGAAAALLTWRLITRRFAHLDLLERAAAASPLFVASVIAIHLVPLALGILSRGTVLGAASLAATGSLLITRAPAAPADPPREPAPASRPLSWAVAAIAGVPVLVAIAANVRDWLPKVFLGLDTLTFHLPNAARFIQSGTLWQSDQFLPLQGQANYPNHGELLDIWAMLPFDNDFLVRWVIVGVLALWVVAIVAAARELGVPPAARVVVASALVTVPVIAGSIVPRAMPDVVLYLGFTCALLFLLRHRRSSRRSDLVLAGLGLGVALGTKWYGVSGAAVVIGVWLVARLLRERSRLRPLLIDTGLLGGVALASGGIWLVRNIAETGDPLFPQKVAPLGITIFDAPHDTYRDQVGFTIAHYFGHPSVLRDIVGEIYDGSGALPFVAVALVLAAAWLAWRRRDLRVGALVTAAVGLFIVYTLTPFSALGFENHPALAEFNTRYGATALICAALAGGWAAGRVRAGIVLELALAAAALESLSDAYGPLHAKQLVLAAAALAAAAGAVVVAIGVLHRHPGLPRRALAASAIGLLALATVAYARRTEQRFNESRYVAFDPTFAAIERAGPGVRVGVAGNWSTDGLSPVWPSFGKRMDNEVEYVGEFRRGFLIAPDNERLYRELLRRGRFDLVVVGRGFSPPARVREQAWTRDAGLVEVAHSTRLLLYAKPSLAARLA